MKLCKKCGKEKPLGSFYKDSRYKDGRRSPCKECVRKNQKELHKERSGSGLCIVCGRVPAVEHNKCKECLVVTRERSLRSYGLYKDKYAQVSKSYREGLRCSVIEAYGSKCSCCGESRQEFLSIDHLDGGGASHRMKVNWHVYLDLKRQGFPSVVQLLCHNCNFTKGLFGQCAHGGVRGYDSLTVSGKQGRRRKQRVIDHYGSMCECCGENNIHFLSIDHVNKDGARHRLEIGEKGRRIYRWLEQQSFPEGFRTLCYNCNFSLGLYGYCPHQEESNNDCSQLPNKIVAGISRPRTL